MTPTEPNPVAAVVTDLDGTLLEPDGSLGDAARGAIGELRKRDIPILVVTSKTEDELRHWLEVLDDGRMGAFENGAGILGPAGMELLPSAIGVEILHGALEGIAKETGLELTTITELSDEELERLTGLSGEDARRARKRRFDLPFLAPPGSKEALSSALPSRPDIQLTRGGVFWHLQGRHSKGEALELLLERYGVGRPLLGLGDAPNDLTFLRHVELPAVIPGESGLSAELRQALPGALTATRPGGAGWAEVVLALVEKPVMQ